MTTFEHVSNGDTWRGESMIDRPYSERPYSGEETRTVSDMTDKLQTLETQIIPQFADAYSKLIDLAERVGCPLPKSDGVEQKPDLPKGHLAYLGRSMETLRGLGDSLHGLLGELNRFI